jgi:hypothetical protein
MEYSFTNDYRIKITGKPEDLKTFIKELSYRLDAGLGYEQIAKEVDSLENIIDMQQYTFGIYHRIYFNKQEIIYTPNVSGLEAKKFHFNIFKKTFDEVIDKLNKK